MPAWLHRFVLAVCAIASIGVIVGLAVVLNQTRAEYARLAEQELVLERLRTDPAYVEMVIRRRLGYAKPDEFVFRFDE
jgi:cell division protein FtsB